MVYHEIFMKRLYIFPLYIQTANTMLKVKRLLEEILKMEERQNQIKVVFKEKYIFL